MTKKLYELWPDYTLDETGYVYYGASQLTDWESIPGTCGGPDSSEFAFGAEIELAGAITYKLTLSAAGEFIVDWGDGSAIDIIKRVGTTTPTTYEHRYAGATEYSDLYANKTTRYTIRIGGVATDYSDNEETAAIKFGNVSRITELTGSLGTVFPTLDDGSQPRFKNAFSGATRLNKISDTLFKGIYGQPVSNMFAGTFNGASSLTKLPDDLFADISGEPVAHVFDSTFKGCSG